MLNLKRDLTPGDEMGCCYGDESILWRSRCLKYVLE